MLQKNNLFKTCLLLLFLTGLSCAKEIALEEVIYKNDFESNNLKEITNGITESYNGSRVLGRYNLDTVGVNIGGLPAHDLIEISLDLYIHDSWDGNIADGISGPDLWSLSVDGAEYINTTFSNAGCGSAAFCNPQSYPHNYLNSSTNPKTGAFKKDLRGVCFQANQIGATTQYKIFKRIRHEKNSITLMLMDNLNQSNIGAANAICDESWSVDNIVIKAIRL